MPNLLVKWTLQLDKVRSMLESAMSAKNATRRWKKAFSHLFDRAVYKMIMGERRKELLSRTLLWVGKADAVILNKKPLWKEATLSSDRRSSATMRMRTGENEHLWRHTDRGTYGYGYGHIDMDCQHSHVNWTKELETIPRTAESETKCIELIVYLFVVVWMYYLYWMESIGRPSIRASRNQSR